MTRHVVDSPAVACRLHLDRADECVLTPIRMPMHVYSSQTPANNGEERRVRQRVVATIVSALAMIIATCIAAPAAHASTDGGRATPRVIDLGKIMEGKASPPAGFTYRTMSSDSLSDCGSFKMCVWTGTGYTGQLLQFGGTLQPGDRVIWANTVWHNNVHSAWNKATVRQTFMDWDNAAGAYLWMPSVYNSPGYGFSCCWPYANRVDGMGWMPGT